MGTPICYGSKDIVRLRVALLDSTGAPDTGSENGYVSDAVIQVVRTPRVEAGEELTLKNGGGDLCQTAQDDDLLKGQDLTVQICTDDLQLIGLMTGATLFEDGTGTMGIVDRLITDGGSPPISFEWFSIAWDGSQQAVIGGSPIYWQRVVPFVTFVRGADTYERGFTIFNLSGKGRENANITRNGPFDDWPAQLPADGPTGGFAEWRTTTLPDAACAFIPVTSAAS